MGAMMIKRSRAKGAAMVLLGLLALLPAGALAATFTPGITTGLGYDDNVNLTSQPQGDFFWLVRPTATLEAGRPENRFSARGSAQYEVYQRLSDNTRLRDASLGLDYHLATSPNWSADISNMTSSSYDAVEQTDTGELTRLRSVGGRHDRNVTGFRTTYVAGPQTQVSAGYTLGMNQGTDENSEDSVYHRADLGGTYRFNSDWRGEVRLQADHDDFQRTDDVNKGNVELRMVRTMGALREAWVSVGAGVVRSESEVQVQRDARDYDVNTAKVGYKTELTPQVGLEASAGVSQVKADERYNTAAGKVYPAGNLTLTYRQPRWQLRGYAEYKLAEYDTLGENSGLTVTNRVGASWQWDMAQHWKLSAQADYVHDDFKQNPTFASVTGTGDVDSVRLGSALTYQLARDWKLSLDYRYLIRDAEADQDDRSQNRVLMLLSADWPQRW
jgi:hypothetical protein